MLAYINKNLLLCAAFRNLWQNKRSVNIANYNILIAIKNGFH